MTDGRAAGWSEVQRLLDGALDLRPQERETWLARSCGADDALHAQVLALLRSCERAESTDEFLAPSAVAFAAPLLVEAARVHDETRAERGRALAAAIERASDGRYVLVHEIGRGGMATVYAARDRRHERRVAVKVLDRSIAPAAAWRFLREVRTTAALNHPHIVAVHDSGAADGCLYFVMPLIDGETLQDRLRRTGRLPLPEVVRLLRNVADALAHAHAQDLVHRDLKPANVLLSGGHALVADFGIAKALRVAEPDGDEPGTATEKAVAGHTSTGVVPGTPAYMAPEQRTGRAADARTDLYALGIMVYEALTGVHPFAARDRHDRRRAPLDEAPPAIDRLRGDVPPDLAALVLRLLAHDPEDRPADAGAVLRTLDDIAVPRLRPARGRRAPLAITAALIVLVALGGFSAWRVREQPAIPPASDGAPAAPRGTADRQAYDQYLRGRYLFLERGGANLESAIRHFRAAIARDPSFARAHAGLAMAYAVLPLYAPAADSALELAAPAAARAVALDSTLADARVALATSYDLQLRFEEADAQYRAAIALQPEDATLHHWYGFFLFATGRTEAASRELLRAVQLDPLAKSAGSAAALPHIAMGRFDAARAELLRVLSVDSTFHLALFGLSMMHVLAGAADSAVVLLERAARNDDDSPPGMRHMLLFAYAAAGRWAEAGRERARLGNGADLSARLDRAFAALVFGDRDPLVRLLLSEEGRRRWYFDYGFGCHPFNRPLWGDARFTGMVRALGVEPCPHPQTWPLAGAPGT